MSIAPTATAEQLTAWPNSKLFTSSPQRTTPLRLNATLKAMSKSVVDVGLESQATSSAPLQRIFFSPHPDDIAYSAFGTASSRPAPRCCHHDSEDLRRSSAGSTSSTMSGFEAAIPSPALSACSRFSDDATLVGSPAVSPSPSMSSYPSSTFSSRRNSTFDDIQNALIVTVFSKSRCANGEIGERLKHNVEATTSLRTDEDEAFARSVGCDLLQLGFPDSSARDEPSRRPELAERAINGKAGTKVERVDHYIYEDVRRALEPIVWMAIRSGAKIHLPLGVGCHVDHWMVRVAVLTIMDELDAKLIVAQQTMSRSLRAIFTEQLIGGQEPLHERLIFYEDLPYADAQTIEHIEGLARGVLPHGAKAQLVHISESTWHKKRAAILSYASQMKPTILPSLYGHAVRLAELGKIIDPDWDASSKSHLAAERIWIIDAALRRESLLREQDESAQAHA